MKKTGQEMIPTRSNASSVKCPCEFLCEFFVKPKLNEKVYYTGREETKESIGRLSARRISF